MSNPGLISVAPVSPVAAYLGGKRRLAKTIIERIERLEEEKATIGDDIKDVYGEAKGEGYDTKAMRTIVKMRKKDQGERKEEELVLNTYLIALGMAPLGDDEGDY